MKKCIIVCVLMTLGLIVKSQDNNLLFEKIKELQRKVVDTHLPEMNKMFDYSNYTPYEIEPGNKMETVRYQVDTNTSSITVSTTQWRYNNTVRESVLYTDMKFEFSKKTGQYNFYGTYALTGYSIDGSQQLPSITISDKLLEYIELLERQLPYTTTQFALNK